MGLFNLFKQESQQDVPKNEKSLVAVMSKCMDAVKAYQNHEFTIAATLFEEYFTMKGYGIFPELDMDDYHMYINFMLSQFYSQNYLECIKTCEILSLLEPKRGDSYAFKALCLLKIGKEPDAVLFWEKANSLGCKLSSHFDNIRDVKMDGYNN